MLAKCKRQADFFDLADEWGMPGPRQELCRLRACRAGLALAPPAQAIRGVASCSHANSRSKTSPSNAGLH